MIKYLSILFLFISSYCNGDGQVLSGPETVRNYSIAQKRLLVISTTQFANIITQNDLDQDSVMSIACDITGMPFLLPYSEGFLDSQSGGGNLINTGKIVEAKQLLHVLSGEKKIQLLIELAIWYLHQPGTHKRDLDSTDIYLNAVSKLIATGKYMNWRYECDFLFGELLYQRTDITAAQKKIAEIVINSEQEFNYGIAARGWELLANMLPVADSAKPGYYQKSLVLYQKLGLKEKQIELLGEMSMCYINTDVDLMEKNYLQIISLMQSTGFKHSLFTKNLLAWVKHSQTKIIEGLILANAALENMKWSEINSVAGVFFIRIANLWHALGKSQDALAWFKKALSNGTHGNHLFWYKSLFFTHSLLIEMNKPGESLSIVNSTVREFPPTTIWEKMQVISCKGECLERLNEADLADETYMQLLKMAKDNPRSDPFGELGDTYLQIGIFYISHQDLKKARLFLDQALLLPRQETPYQTNKYTLLYKIDSLQGKYKSALQNHITYKLYFDSVAFFDQRQKMDELTIKYAAEKKDQDIKLLKQQGIVQQAELKQNKIARNIMVGGSVMLLTFLGLLYNRFRLKQRTNKQLEYQQNEIAKKNASLQELVEQKEWLLKEVHHRVKNNLQIIISLLNTQSNYLDSNAAVKAIRESQERMNAISLIHQKLYKSEDTAFINIKEYVHELVEHIRNSFSNSSGTVFELNISDSQMDVAQAVPLGLILNEAISNAVKYAFPGQTPGRVSISITHSSVTDDYLLTIADNGVGLPTDYDLSKKASFGIRLMQGLSKQLGGSFNIENINGVKVKASFKGSAVMKIVWDKKTTEDIVTKIQDSKYDYSSVIR